MEEEVIEFIKLSDYEYKKANFLLNRNSLLNKKQKKEAVMFVSASFLQSLKNN
ncbi:hypothetical protein EMIT019CA3_360013 [Bacillus pseudomycoides]